MPVYCKQHTLGEIWQVSASTYMERTAISADIAISLCLQLAATALSNSMCIATYASFDLPEELDIPYLPCFSGWILRSLTVLVVSKDSHIKQTYRKYMYLTPGAVGEQKLALFTSSHRQFANCLQIVNTLVCPYIPSWLPPTPISLLQ